MERNQKERSVRIWRVFSLLNGVPINQVREASIHVISYAAADYIIAYRETIGKQYAEMVFPTEWDWAISRRSVEALWARNPVWMSHVYYTIASKQRRGSPKIEKTHFLLMCLDIMQTQSATFDS